MAAKRPAEPTVPRIKLPKWREDISQLEEMLGDLMGIGKIWQFLKKNVDVMKHHWLLCAVLIAIAGMGGFWLRGKSLVVKTPSAVVLPSPVPIKLEMTDVDSRKEIGALRLELAATKEALRTAQIASDPLSKPIVSVRFTISLDFENYENTVGHEIDDGLLLVLVAGDQGILHGTTTEHFDNGLGQRRYFVDIPFDSGNMGKPVSTLSNADSIIMQFKELLTPMGTVVCEGQIAMVVNNQITVKFTVPEQTIERKANDNPVIIVKEIQADLHQVITPPSSVRNAATSPH